MLAFKALMFSRGTEVKRVRGPSVDRLEMERTLKKFVGKPVTAEHVRPVVKLGEVSGYVIDETGDGYIIGAVSTKGPLGKAAVDDIRSGVIKGVSFSAKARINELIAKRYSDYDPVEVSLVKKGGVDRSRIVLTTDGRTYSIYSGGILEVCGLSQPKASMSEAEGTLTSDERAKLAGMTALLQSIGCSGSLDEIQTQLNLKVERLNELESSSNKSSVDKMKNIMDIFAKSMNDDEFRQLTDYMTESVATGASGAVVEVMAGISRNFTQLQDTHTRIEAENADLKAKLEASGSAQKKATASDLVQKKITTSSAGAKPANAKALAEESKRVMEHNIAELREHSKRARASANQ